MKSMNMILSVLDKMEAVEVFCPVCGNRSTVLGVEESVLVDVCPVCDFEVVFEASRRSI